MQLYVHNDLSLNGDELLGAAEVSLASLIHGREKRSWFRLRNDQLQSLQGEAGSLGDIELRLLWCAMTEDAERTVTECVGIMPFMDNTEVVSIIDSADTLSEGGHSSRL